VPAAIAAFIRARLDDEERDAALFHELDCPIPADPLIRPTAERAWCRCPCPRRLLEHIETRRRIVCDCEQRIHHCDPYALDRPEQMAFARQSLAALTLAYEHDSRWREEWRP
jgi:hypothetical protein